MEDFIRESSGNGKFYIIPQDPNDYDILLAVSAKTRVDVERKYGFYMDNDWQTNTVADAIVETMLSEMNYKFNADGIAAMGVSFFDIFVAKVSLKTNAKAEKEGNINIYFEPGEKADWLIANGPIPPHKGMHVNVSQELLTDDEFENEFITKLDQHTRYELSKNHGISISTKKPLVAVAIAKVFFENLYTELITRAAQRDEGEDESDTKLVTVNFNDVIEIHAERKGDDVRILMRPGMNAKLLIKNDGMTERTLGDMDE